MAEELFEAVVSDLAGDFLMALRYFYYVKTRSLVPDHLYDIAEKEYLSRSTTDSFSTPLNLPGSDNPETYEDRIKCLALYLALNDAKKMQEHKARPDPAVDGESQLMH